MLGRVIICGLEPNAVKVARSVPRGERFERVGPTRYMYTVGLDKLKPFLILFSQFQNMHAGAASTALRKNHSKKVVSDSEGINNSDKTAGNNRIKQILFGSLLGDGRLEMSPRSINARFGFTQSSPPPPRALLSLLAQA